DARKTMYDTTAMPRSAVLTNHTHKHRLPEPENRRTLVLSMALQRVNHFPGISQRHIAKNFHLSGFRIDFNFGGAETDLPKWRRATQRNVVISWELEETPSPNLSLGVLKMPLHDFCKAELLLSANDHSIIQANCRNRRVKHVGGGREKLPARVLSRFLYGLSHNRSRAARIRAFIEG